jgi:thiosulfate/3-mercaptopyruvate sulfurtransferase
LVLKRFLLFCVMGFWLSTGWAAAPLSPLVSAGELAALLKQPQNQTNTIRVIDIRKATSYKDNHIEIASNSPFEEWRGPTSSPAQLPSLDKLTQLMQKHGLTANTPTILVSTGVDSIDFGTAAWVYWVLKEHGIKEVSILNGGMKAWLHAGQPYDDEVIKITPTTFVPVRSGKWTADRAEVAKAVSSGQVAVMDSRPEAFFNGDTRHALVKVPGTIKGASNLSFEKWFIPNNPNFASFVPPDTVKKVWAASGVKAQTPTIAFCNTGHWSAINWFAASELLGQPNAKLYAGSMQDWSQDASLPMSNVPNRAKQLMIDAKLWSDK